MTSRTGGSALGDTGEAEADRPIVIDAPPYLPTHGARAHAFMVHLCVTDAVRWFIAL